MSTRDDQKQQVQQSTDIVRLIGEHVALRPRGREFIGLCPFHDDKNPSMYVSPGKQIYKCFSCGAGGDAFSFVMQYHKMTFPEAIKHLAERAGIKLEPMGRGHGSHDDGQPSDRQRIAQANAQAVEFFRALYRHSEHGAIAREYVEKRKISPEMIEQFQLGYAPDRWDGLALMINQKHWDLRAFELAGLVNTRQNGPGHYDRLRHRIIFPICDSLGRPIAFGGRKIRDEDEPKYLNSPETALFNKSATLYGLHLAKKAIIDSRTAVIVEGYTDVIACHQAGVRNVVATLGTALTPQHIGELRRYCDKVALIYDADEAGIKAADRAVEIFLTEGLDVAIAVLPDEMDPAELFETPDGLQRWHDSITNATDALDFQFQRSKAKFDAADTVTGRERLATEYLGRIASISTLDWLDQGSMRRAMVVERLSHLLHMDSPSVNAILVKSMRAAAQRNTPRPPVNSPAPAATPNASDSGITQTSSPAPVAAMNEPSHKIRALQVAARQVIGCLLQQPELFHCTLSDGRSLDEAITPAEIFMEPERSVYQFLYDQLSENNPVSLSSMLAELSSRGNQAACDLLTEADAEVDRCVGKEVERIPQVLTLAADALQKHLRDRQYQEMRRSTAASTAQDGSTPADEASLLRRMTEHQRTPSVLRIARRNPG